MTTYKTAAEYLAEWEYEDVEAWARDSDFTEGADGLWRDDEGNVQDIEGALEGAIEAYELAMAAERAGFRMTSAGILIETEA